MAKYDTLKNIRWTKRELNGIVQELGLTEVETAHDSKGYYIRSCEAAQDPLPAVVLKLKDQLREVQAAKRTGQGRGRRAPDRRPGTPNKGVCAAVREWASTHPGATVQDAVQAFPEANKTTVRIQFKKAVA